ncbi:MAG: crosslink repair DNA glycosylase YcaQ family protein [Propioniciclava sp.]|uniref:winged helix-turn-helix domain-containing protein n=1 Tax=Propioniciclava sp. TaxID=2038686 RepID=UPI0039E5DA61
MPGRLTLRQARRIALAAQGFGRRKPASVGPRQLQAEIDRLAQFQIDSVNVAVRAHLMPAFARLGDYDTALLTRAWQRTPRRVFEYWGHAASLVDVTLHPALRWRMRRYAERPWPGVQRALQERPGYVGEILAEVAAHGPVTARQIADDAERARDHWGWNWSDAKHVLEHLFSTGAVAIAGRTASFERLYDLPERVLPPAVLAAEELSEPDAYDVLIARAARALGVADLGALTDYFYLRRADARASVRRLTQAGLLEPVEVAGVAGEHWLWHQARTPRALHAQALVSPFDSMVFQRERLEGLFATHYRIEIYTPAAQRRHGYYVYLFWHGEAPAARVDLKADRAAGVLIVQASWLEEGADAVVTAAALASELHAMAIWLGLNQVVVVPRGDLAAALAHHC